MRTTVTIDNDVYEAALSVAKSTGRRLGEVLSEMARTALQRQPPRRRRGRRFATFDVPPDAPIISAERVRKAIEDKGIV